MWRHAAMCYVAIIQSNLTLLWQPYFYSLTPYNLWKMNGTIRVTYGKKKKKKKSFMNNF